MQEFLVDRHTTPATPALDPINVPKVPIYDTIADAESDLSNLEVGQILKTKDAGLVANLNPIDEVKQGVFLPPTSNAVAESLSYSTTEQKTGGKWIDGKPIYRKCIPFNNHLVYSSWTDTGFDYRTLDLENITNANCYGTVQSMSNAGDTTTFINVIADSSTHTFKVSMQSAYYMKYLILEYTKTTD